MGVNREIREHPEGIPAIGDVFIFQSLVDLKTKRVKVDQFITSEVSGDFTWTSAKAVAGDYDTDIIVEHEGNLYKSVIDDNPSVPGTNGNWTLLIRGSSGFTFWTAGTFIEDNVFVLKVIDGETHIVELVSATRPYESSNFATEYNAGDWVSVTQNVITKSVPILSNVATLDMNHLKERCFIVFDSVANPLSILITNDDKATTIKAATWLMVTLDTITFESNVKITGSDNAVYDSTAHTWTPLELGRYKMNAFYDSFEDEWQARIEGPYV